ncbi:MAG: phenylacetate--CoA ligase family protein [Actinobacteria bacterium]|nr:phenylacetate--CoA ligase family protein [Actinomycetota bacterium]
MLRLGNPDGSYDIIETTPENTQRVLANEPLYAADTDDPNFMAPDEIRALQNGNLRRQLERVKDGSAYYKGLFKREKIDPDKIETVDDLVRLPLTSKADYMSDPEAFRLKLSNPTLYDWLWDVTYTTGTTTGIPTPFYNTILDAYATYRLIFRAIKIGGGLSTTRVVNLFPLGPIPHIGFFRARDIIAMMPYGQGSFACTGMPHPEFKIHRSLDYAVELIEKIEGQALVGIASFIRRVIMKAEQEGRDYSQVHGVELLGEAAPKGMRDDVRRRLENMGADRPFIANSYGFTEMQGAMSECEEFSGCHNPDDGLYFFEVVDEKTLERLPDGEVGLLVITHLNRTGTVLLRYVVGDYAAITHEPCPFCGRTGTRTQITVGSTYATRTSELVNLKGTLINPEILRDEIANTAGIAEYQVVFTKKDPSDPYSPDELVIRVGKLPDRSEKDIEEELQQRILRAVEMRARIEFAELSEIFDPDESLKAVRIVDLRPKE